MMLKALRLALMYALLLPMLVVTASVVLVFYVIEQKPLVAQNSLVDHQTVAAGKTVLNRIVRQLAAADDEGAILEVTEAEFRHLAQMGSYTFTRLNTDLFFDRASINFFVSVQLVPNPIGEYLNLVFHIGQSSEGLSVDRLSIGRLKLPGGWLLPFAVYLADTVLQNQHASELLAGIQGFSIEGDAALFSVLPPPNMEAKLKQAIKALQASRFPPGEQARIVHYYSRLATMGSQGYQRGHSFSAYVTPLMTEAAARRALSSAVAENRAVIWALFVYFSHGAFEGLMGDPVSSQHALVKPPSGTTLGGRWDLMAHFIYSAGIAVATQQGIGIAAGEFKELLDSGGGSGFSFADLAADRAGIHFVAAATSSESSARQFQRDMIANTSESAFFPDIAGLREGLSEVEFEQLYGSIQSERYREQVALIDQRIAGLVVYQGNSSVQ